MVNNDKDKFILKNMEDEESPKMYSIGFDIDKNILETSKLYKNIDGEDLKIIDELFNYLSSNTIKYIDKDLRFLSVSVFIISKIINKPTYKILEDLNII